MNRLSSPIFPILVASAFATAPAAPALAWQAQQAPQPATKDLDPRCFPIICPVRPVAGTAAPAAALDSGGEQVIAVKSVRWAALGDDATRASSDPEEGGQIAATADKPKVGEINVTKLSDKSSANLAQRTMRPGRPTYGNVAIAGVAEPLPSGSATFVARAGICATGKHLDKVRLTMGSRSFTLHDATVTGVTPADAVDGQAMEQVTITYASLGN